ncbi:MAG: enoyl-CoA hydratase/isomerase family protein [Saprospiraceae bacterium]
MNQYVNRIDNGRLAVIEFYTEKSNSLPSIILNKLAEEISNAGSDDNIQLILLKSSGEKTFCAGASFVELSGISNKEEGLDFFSGFSKVILTIRDCKKIVIGRIHGNAVGGGVGIAAACDYSLASIYASIRLSELAIGIGPFVIGPVVERKIGLAAFSQMALNATEWQTAQWAKEKGLFQEVFESTEQLDDYIQHFTQILLNSNPEALKQLKNIFWEGTDHWPMLLKERAGISGELILSEFSKKAVSKISFSS